MRVFQLKLFFPIRLSMVIALIILSAKSFAKSFYGNQFLHIHHFARDEKFNNKFTICFDADLSCSTASFQKN